MKVISNSVRLLLVAGIAGLCSPSVPASAITAELAKKCRDAALKAHPTPRAGTKTGAAKAQQDFFRSCVAKDGNIEN